jgi:hypothetical protein
MRNWINRLLKFLGFGGSTSNPKFCYVKGVGLSSGPTPSHSLAFLSSIGVSPKDKTWEKGKEIRIAFIGGTQAQRAMVKKYGGEWLSNPKYPLPLTFKYVSLKQSSDVRISFEKGVGSWSYLGTDAKFVSSSKATMNFSWLDAQVIRHEFGHMVGALGHEHAHKDRTFEFDEKAVMKSVSNPPNNWSYKTAFHNIFRKASEKTHNFSDYNPNSIMLYFYPPSWTKSGKGTNRNEVISEGDFKFTYNLYNR